MFSVMGAYRVSKTDQALPHALGQASLISEERLTNPPRLSGFVVAMYPPLLLAAVRGPVCSHRRPLHKQA